MAPQRRQQPNGNNSLPYTRRLFLRDYKLVHFPTNRPERRTTSVSEPPGQHFDPIRAAAEENGRSYTPLGQNFNMHTPPVSPLSQAPPDQTSQTDDPESPAASDDTEVHIKEEHVSPGQQCINILTSPTHPHHLLPSPNCLPAWGIGPANSVSWSNAPANTQHSYPPPNHHSTIQQPRPSTLQYPPAPTVEDAPDSPPSSWSSALSNSSSSTSTTLPFQPHLLPSPFLVHPTVSFPAHPTPLFTDLEAICTSAASAYYRSQCQSHLDPRGSPARNRYRYSPYNRSSGRTPEEGRMRLMDYLQPICNKIWQRAQRLKSHAAELEAVHRMGNLYAWGERIVEAARGLLEEGVVREGEEQRWAYVIGRRVLDVLLAGRDLCAALSNEEGKREVDELLEGFWRIGGM